VVIVVSGFFGSDTADSRRHRDVLFGVLAMQGNQPDFILAPYYGTWKGVSIAVESCDAAASHAGVCRDSFLVKVGSSSCLLCSGMLL
jgi:hypothetical protein